MRIDMDRKLISMVNTSSYASARSSFKEGLTKDQIIEEMNKMARAGGDYTEQYNNIIDAFTQSINMDSLKNEDYIYRIFKAAHGPWRYKYLKPGTTMDKPVWIKMIKEVVIERAKINGWNNLEEMTSFIEEHCNLPYVGPIPTKLGF